MFSSDIPTYIIDLQRSEIDRWDEVARVEKDVVQGLATEVINAIASKVPPEFRQRGREALEAIVEKNQQFRLGEMKCWGAWLQRPYGEVLLFNLLYELSHVANKMGIGCTTGVVPTRRGQIHVRTLDWAMHSIGPATRVFRFRYRDREFVTVGIPGYVGVLSGMLLGKNGYSITMNGAPAVKMPSFHVTPSLLVRWVLENCDVYQDAIEQLSIQPVASSVFFTVCDSQSDEACVIERIQYRSAVQERYGPSLVVTNHFHHSDFERHNDPTTLGDSEYRLSEMRNALNRQDHTFESAFACLGQSTVPDTVQRIAFCPKTGEIKVERRVSY